jgi:pyruvate-formate lyase
VSSINAEGVTKYEVVDKLSPYWEIPLGKKIVLQSNQSIQPVRFSTNKFRRTCGNLVRVGQFVNMQDEWGSVVAEKRQRLWEALMVCYICHTFCIYIYIYIL